jgi:cytochrome c oxidase subunit 2
MNPIVLLQVPLMPEQASTFAQEVDLFYIALVLLTVFFTVAVAAVAAYFMVKYHRKRADEIPENIHGAMLLEITWTVAPLIISLGIFAWGVKLFYEMYTPPKDSMEVFVTGKQWMWRAQHPDGRREINELHVPLGRRVKLTMTSEDVIHSYYIPAFRTKMDAVPGRYTTMWFEATKPGSYHLFCAEYCGTQHSGMVGTVHVLDKAEYQAWLAGTRGGVTPAQAGQTLFNTLGCVSCHKEDNSGRGPSLAGVYGSQQKLDNGQSVLVDDVFVRESILNPHTKIAAGYPLLMSTYQGQLTEEEVGQLIAYLKSIGKQAGAEGSGGQPGQTNAPAALPPAVAPAGTPRPAAGSTPPAAAPARPGNN